MYPFLLISSSFPPKWLKVTVFRLDPSLCHRRGGVGDRSNEAEPLSVTRMPEAAAPGPYVAPSLWLCNTRSHTEERVKSIQDPFICLEAVPQFTLCSPV